MPRFFFNFIGGEDSAIDDVGCDFPDLDLAYLDAYRSMVRIGAEMLLEQQDPSRQSIQITDERGTILMTLPFDDVFRPREQRHDALPEGTLWRTNIESSRRLKQDIRAACVEARATVEAARMTLGRAASRGGVRIGLGW